MIQNPDSGGPLQGEGMDSFLDLPGWVAVLALAVMVAPVAVSLLKSAIHLIRERSAPVSPRMSERSGGSKDRAPWRR